MKHTIVCIRDIKTNSYFVPQYIKSVGGFLRQMGDELNGPQNPNTVAETMSKHPEDFELYQLGTWDDETGQYELTEKTQLCVVSSLITR